MSVNSLEPWRKQIRFYSIAMLLGLLLLVVLNAPGLLYLELLGRYWLSAIGALLLLGGLFGLGLAHWFRLLHRRS